MTLASRIRERLYRTEIRDRREFYDKNLSKSERELIQLDLLNATWERNLKFVPRLREMRRAGRVPSRFASLSEFASVVPSMTRETLQNELQTATSTERAPELQKLTGGSTAKPIQIPFWNSELEFGRPDGWTARSWYGISPSSKLFHLWGHSHLLGAGATGWINARKRELYDHLLGYRRHSAYDLSPRAMRSAVRDLIEFRPEYILGYSVALDLMARESAEFCNGIRELRLKVAIGTAESFPSDSSESMIHDLWSCPVAMEYGAVETGILAHSRPEGGYLVFWRSFLLEAEASSGGPRKLRITSLYPRSLPLVRYEIGDEVMYSQHPERVAVGLDRFERVVGRCNDYVELANGRQIHSEAFSHAVRPVAPIRGYQVHQESAQLRLRCTTRAPLTDSDRAGIRDRLARIDPLLEGIVIEEVDSLEQTVAGKTRMVVRRDT